MRRLFSALLMLAAVLVVRPAWAPPPIGVFPAAVVPAAGAEAPANARIWAFGASAPALDRIDFAVTVDGAPVSVTPALLGCCAVYAALPAGLATGLVSARVSSGATDVSTVFALTSTVDVTAPQLTRATVLEDLGGTLVIGVDGTDDLGLAGFVARVDGAVRSTAPAGQLLRLVPGDDGCVAVTAIDLAGLESAAQPVCGARPDGGVSDAGGSAADAGVGDAGTGAEDGGGCSTVRGDASWALLAGALILLRRRARRSSPGA